jgi:hypothetical protein
MREKMIRHIGDLIMNAAQTRDPVGFADTVAEIHYLCIATRLRINEFDILSDAVVKTIKYFKGWRWSTYKDDVSIEIEVFTNSPKDFKAKYPSYYNVEDDMPCCIARATMPAIDARPTGDTVNSMTSQPEVSFTPKVARYALCTVVDGFWVDMLAQHVLPNDETVTSHAMDHFRMSKSSTVRLTLTAKDARTNVVHAFAVERTEYGGAVSMKIPKGDL